MGTAWSVLRSDIRNRLVETSADFFSNAELLEWGNYGYKNFIARTEWTEKIKAYPMVANQYEYDLPSDALKVNLVMFEDSYRVVPKDLEEFRRYVGFADGESDRPDIYRLWPHDGKIRVYPIPSTASASSTISGAHNTTVTTVSLVDATNFPERGRAIINGSEQIMWFAKSGNNLTQVVRGSDYSSAASYAGGETIAYAPMEVYLSYMPASLSADGDTLRIGPVFEEAIVHYVVATGLMKRDKYKEAEKHKSAFDEICKKAREERDKQNRDRLFYIKEDDSWSDL